MFDPISRKSINPRFLLSVPLFFDHPAALAAMGNRRTDRVIVAVRNQEIGVGAILAERVLAHESEFLAGLPPAVDGGGDVRV
jgi:hypothetical protein